MQVDTSLSVSGDAADAKIAGDAISGLQKTVENAINDFQGMVGTPLIASTAANMVDTSKIYVYTGSETGYTNGNWYYYNGISWTSGGVYNAVTVDLDTTLKIPNKAAESKAVGDEITLLKNALKYKINTSLVDGYWNADGSASNSSSSGVEKRTEMIPVSYVSSIFINVSFLTNHNNWCSCLFLDDSNAPISRPSYTLSDASNY